LKGGSLPIVLLALQLAGCGSPATQVFDLSPTADPPAAATPSGSGPLIYVDTPSVAGYFDRTQMVMRTGTNRVSLHEFEVWSDPPADLIARAVVDDLSHQFGDKRVMRTPAASYATPDWRVELDVIRFDVSDNGQALLDARWTLVAARPGRLAATQREHITIAVANPKDPTERVQALRQAVAILSSHIGDAIAHAGLVPP
jgi:uncharacterized protein